MGEIGQLKSEISDQYLENFKQELGWIKSLALLPIEKKVKKILTWEFQLPEKFDEVKEFGSWKEIINFISPALANQIFDFMKEKRLKIEERKTEEELRNLKAEILWNKKEKPNSNQQEDAQNNQTDSYQKNTEKVVVSDSESQTSPSDQKGDSQNVSQIEEDSSDQAEKTDSSRINSVSTGVTTSVAWVSATKILANKLNARELSHMAEKFDAKQAKEILNNAIEALEKQKVANNSRLSTKQIKTIDKHIEKLKNWMASADDDVIKLLKEWQKLDTKLPKKLLVECGLTVSQLTKIDKLAPQLVGKDSQAIKEVLVQNGLSKVSDDLISALSKASTEAELKSMTMILKHWTKINRFVQTFSGAMLIDVACLWLDVRMYLETQKEADLIEKVNEVRAQNKKNQANTQLWIGISSVAVEAAIIITAMSGGTAVGGPFGTVAGLVVGGASAAASIGVDTLYFDVKDFYMQNKEDFIRQKHAQLVQAILQGLHNQKIGNSSLNEIIGSPEPSQKVESLNDACWSMLFLDELQNGDFAGYGPFWEYLQGGEKKSDFEKRLSSEQLSEFRQKWSEIEKKIAKRMEYLHQMFEKPELVQVLKKWNAMAYISLLSTQSKAYGEMQACGKWNQSLDFNKNLANYKSDFFADFSKEKLKKIEKIKTEQPELFQELMATASLSSLLKETQIDLNYDENVKLVAKYQEWIDLTATNEEKIKLEIPDSYKNMRFIEGLLEADFEVDKVSFPGNSVDQIKGLVALRQERYAEMEVSDDSMQNVLYRLAKELYGYSGNNKKADLMSFYSENLANNQGIYFSDKRKINEDWRKDFSLNTELPSRFPESELNAKVDKFLTSEFWTHWIKQITMFGIAWWLFWSINTAVSWTRASSIDTPTETMDTSLQKEFEAKIHSLLKEELSYHTLEYQKKIKSQISSFVAKNAKNWAYIELPYYLLIQARRAGLGDLQRKFFTRKNNKLEILSMKSELSNDVNLDAHQQYLTPQRESYTSEEQSLISRVEVAHKKLLSLRKVQGVLTHEDELDLPKEVEVLIGDKYKEWEKFKSDLLYYDAEVAVSTEILDRYQEFAKYFEDLYSWILISLSTFKTSNDIDSFWLYQQALSYGEGNFFDNQGNLRKQPEEWGLELLKNQKVSDFYTQQLKKQKIWSKTLEQLWNSEDKNEKNLAHQGSMLILTVILEKGLLNKAKNNQVKDIKIWSNYWDSDTISALDNSDELTMEITKNLASISTVSFLDSWKINKLIQNPIQIKSLSSSQEQLVRKVNPLQKKIEKTAEDIVWQDKRGNILYDPEKSLIQSWGSNIKLTEKAGKYYLKDLNLWLDLESALRLANLANRAKATYKGKIIAFESEWIHDAFVVKWEGIFADDIEILSQDTLGQHCPFAKDDKKAEHLANWLTKVIK